MSANKILCCVIVVIINDYIYLYVNQLYYARALILTIYIYYLIFLGFIVIIY